MLLSGMSKVTEERFSITAIKSDLSGPYYINAIPRERTFWFMY